MVADQSFWTISKFQEVQIKLDQKVANNVCPAKVLGSIVFEW